MLQQAPFGVTANLQNFAGPRPRNIAAEHCFPGDESSAARFLAAGRTIRFALEGFPGKGVSWQADPPWPAPESEVAKARALAETWKCKKQPIPIAVVDFSVRLWNTSVRPLARGQAGAQKLLHAEP